MALTGSKTQLSISAQVGRVYLNYLRRMVHRAATHMPTRLNRLSIVLVGNAEMGRLHKQFMKISGPTDVLTFDLEGDGTEGEIVICVPAARREAKAHGIAVQNELLLYAIHGMLHLAGFDDRTKSAYEVMHRKEDQILEKLGVGKVFAAKHAGRGK